MCACLCDRDNFKVLHILRKKKEKEKKKSSRTSQKQDTQ